MLALRAVRLSAWRRRFHAEAEQTLFTVLHRELVLRARERLPEYNGRPSNQVGHLGDVRLSANHKRKTKITWITTFFGRSRRFLGWDIVRQVRTIDKRERNSQGVVGHFNSGRPDGKKAPTFCPPPDTVGLAKLAFQNRFQWISRRGPDKRKKEEIALTPRITTPRPSVQTSCPFIAKLHGNPDPENEHNKGGRWIVGISRVLAEVEDDFLRQMDDDFNLSTEGLFELWIKKVSVEIKWSIRS
ncbi:hypothetical protein C8F04DRAFT_1174223 [Mycena alexandri]|uniref:Uncharacterized protein n=1 Tax=Mycena alexandri TaxID=1745969 RepID=A0AAD6XEE5_9AGAR|nr:hypothetical protein C8F04DRAFT_1174223 [Mycena alexandri]